MCYWKCGFDLLAVCRRWRNVAKELIYCNAHIEKPAQPDDFACNSPDGFYTSLDLICANHQLSTVKHLSVDLQTADFIADFEHTNMLIGNASAAGLPKAMATMMMVMNMIMAMATKPEAISNGSTK
ncbi:hypothetical protein LPJ63_000482 [Coemansia sp. RSA 2711]|nr:hypothetical protein LPJ63_000482 [Coemansia sp. RSA 2711]